MSFRTKWTWEGYIKGEPLYILLAKLGLSEENLKNFADKADELRIQVERSIYESQKKDKSEV